MVMGIIVKTGKMHTMTNSKKKTREKLENVGEFRRIWENVGEYGRMSGNVGVECH